MKCKEATDSIYLYPELTPAEKEDLHQHLKGCASCFKIWEEQAELARLIDSVRDSSIAPVDAARLTDKVMEAINDPGEQKRASPFFNLVGWLRLAMTASCVFLAALFMYQYESPSGEQGKNQLPQSNTSTLAVQGINILRQQETIYKPSLYALIKENHENQ